MYIQQVVCASFPSPCGVNIVGNLGETEWCIAASGGVSVPLRGKYCREWLINENAPPFEDYGFRPLAG